MSGTVLSAGDSKLIANPKIRSEPFLFLFFRDNHEFTEESQGRKRKRLVGRTFVDTEQYTV